MFEFDQQIVDALLSESADFQRLYKKHVELKQRVHDANVRANLMDDMALENLKKEKLLIKDKMAAIIADYRRAHA
ncbi:MAG: YdcH family protein [Gammaproteobacteria bacterium]|nr:YdcH family protein [Gammaproteobacteria bacterium]